MHLAVLGREGAAFLERIPVDSGAGNILRFERGSIDQASSQYYALCACHVCAGNAHGPVYCFLYSAAFGPTAGEQVDFYGPDIRPVTAVWLAPERGTWTVEARAGCEPLYCFWHPSL